MVNVKIASLLERYLKPYLCERLAGTRGSLKMDNQDYNAIIKYVNKTINLCLLFVSMNVYIVICVWTVFNL